MTSEERIDKAYGSMLGLAMGDASGFPAMFHRALMSKWGRNLLWEFCKRADEQRINKFSLPFTLSQPEDLLHLCGTDDTEFAVVSALILMECGEDVSTDRLFAGWRKYVVDHEDTIWSGISERASIENAKKGMIAPATGNDNPHHFDDGAIARAVPIGLKYSGRPEMAAEVAGRMASITNAEDGVFAAQAMAASIAIAVDGATPEQIVEAGIQFIPEDSWLGRKVRQARSILEEAGSGFAAVPGWNDRIVNQIYNYGNVAPQTLAIAYAAFIGVQGNLQQGLQLAALMPKQSDSMPAMVGALAGALHGASAIPAQWAASLDTLKGVCIPHLKAISLKDIAIQLMR